MNKLYGLIAGVALAGVAPFALADADPLYLQPEVGGAEVTFAVKADNTGINSQVVRQRVLVRGHQRRVVQLRQTCCPEKPGPGRAFLFPTPRQRFVRHSQARGEHTL